MTTGQERLLSPNVLQAALKLVGPDHPASAAAVAMAISGEVGEDYSPRGLVSALIDQATRHGEAAPHLQDAVVASGSAYLMLQWADTGFAVDVPALLRSAWEHADGSEMGMVVAHASMSDELLGEVSQDATPLQLARIADSGRAGVAEFLTRNLEQRRVADEQANDDVESSLAVAILSQARGLDDDVARALLTFLPQAPERYEDRVQWERRLTSLVRQSPWLVAVFHRWDHGSLPGHLRSARQVMTDLDNVWALIDAGTLDELVGSHLERLERYLQELRTARSKAHEPHPPTDDDGDDDGDDDEVASLVGVAVYSARTLRFLVSPSPSELGTRRRADASGEPSLEPRREELRALLRDLLRAATPAELGAVWSATGLVEMLVAEETQLSATDLRTVEEIISAIPRQTRGYDPHWPTRMRRYIENATAQAAPPQPFDDLLAALAESPANIPDTAWKYLEDPLAFDAVLAAAPRPEDALVAALDNAARRARSHGLTARRDTRALLAQRVLESRFCTNAAIAALPVTVLGPDLPWGRVSQVAEALTEAVGNRAGLWKLLAAHPAITAGAEAWKPVGALMASLGPVDEPGEPAALATIELLEAAGFATKDARLWAKTGLSMQTVHEWVLIGVTPTQAPAYAELGARTLEDARWCKAQPMSATDARRWASGKVSFAEVQQFAEDGMDSNAMAAYAAAGITGAKKIRSHRAAGVSGTAAKLFHARNITAVSEMSKLIRSGIDAQWLELTHYSIPELRKLHKAVGSAWELKDASTRRVPATAVIALSKKGISVRWAAVLHREGLLDDDFVDAHLEALRTTRPPFDSLYSQRHDVHALLEGPASGQA